MKKSSPAKGIDSINTLAMEIAMWIASISGQNPKDQYLHHLTVESSESPIPTDFAHVCRDAVDAYSFSYMFLKSIIEDSRAKKVCQQVSSGVFEITIEDTVTIRMSIANLSR